MEAGRALGARAEPRSGTTDRGLTANGRRRLAAGALAALALVIVLPVGDAGAASGKPSNTSPPKLTGTPRSGATLTAEPGTWTGREPITYTYAWRRCKPAGTGCADIAGATGTSYVVTALDGGSTIRVRVTARNSAGSSWADSAPTATIESLPANTSPPTVTGTPRDGQTLSASPGTWAGTTPIAYAYQWQRCDALAGCSDVFGATATTYALRSADIGFAMRVVVTASNSLGANSASSAQTAAVQAAPPVSTSPPAISGTARHGETLTADPGSWSGTQPIGFAYRWRRCDALGGACVDIPGATGQSYAVVAADVGARLRVEVTASNTAGTGTAVSAPTVQVTGVAPANTSAPAISGATTEGATLTADPGSWSGTEPIGFGYQWRRCGADGGTCADVAGATGLTHVLTAEDVGATLRVVVTASNAGGSSSATSAQTAVVAGAADQAPLNTAPPTIAGTAGVGRTLTADPGTWAGATPMSFAYRWRRCDAAGAGCMDVAGATEQTYTVVSADAGATLRVAVTASNFDGSRTAVSAATAAIEGVAPQNASAPTISGAPQAAQTLTADPGSWSGTAPIAFAYQWRRCDGNGVGCADVSGATSKTYVPVTADVGFSLRVAVTGTNGAGSATAMSAPTSTVTAAGSIGYWGPSSSGAGTAPTGSKPESKLWFNDGVWWASMWAGGGGGFHIFRLDPVTQRWSDTGVALDDRSGTRADVLWDGAHLYVASHVFSSCGCSTTAAGFPARLYRYSYDAAADRYTLDPGFPVALNNTKSETLVIDRDTTGTLWATWVQDRKVMVTHSQPGDDRAWTTPYVLPVTGAANPSTDDISSLIAYGPGSIGVMWSNQSDGAFYFARHADGTADSSWSVAPALQSPLIADDHLNLKSLQADGSGRVFAVAKTSLNDAATPDAGAPIVILLARTASGQWSNHPVWRLGDGSLTRPILVIDESNSVLHVFATSSESGGSIRTKSSTAGTVAFPSGSGTTFLRDAASSTLNNATSSKQNATRASGLVLLASSDATGYYWHNRQAIP